MSCLVGTLTGFKIMAIMGNKKDLHSEIERDNPWYVFDHNEMYGRKPYVTVTQERVRFVLEEIESFICASNADVRVLDAGCGDGFYLTHLSRFNKVKAFGIDYNPLRIKRAKDKGGGFSLVNGNLSSISVKDNAFDIVLLNHVLEHIENDRGVLLEIYRILKTGGILIVGVPNEGCFIAQIRNNILQRSILKETDHVNFYTEKNIKAKLNTLGFKMLKVRRESFFCPIVQMNELLSSYRYGLKLLHFLGRIFKSQCGGLQLVCRKI